MSLCFLPLLYISSSFTCFLHLLPSSILVTLSSVSLPQILASPLLYSSTYSCDGIDTFLTLFFLIPLACCSFSNCTSLLHIYYSSSISSLLVHSFSSYIYFSLSLCLSPSFHSLWAMALLILTVMILPKDNYRAENLFNLLKCLCVFVCMGVHNQRLG